MKRAVVFILILINVLVGQQTYTIGKYFEGSILYSVQYSGVMEEFWRNNKVPTSVLIHIKDGDYIVHLFNTKFPTTYLYINDSDKTYILDLKNDRAFTKSKVKIEPEPPIAEPINDTTTILGYKCKAYKVVKKDETIIYYVSDEIRVNLEYFKGKKNAKAFFLTRGLDGRIPLKMIRKFYDSTVISTATKITWKKYKSTQFRLPPGIKILGYDFRR